MRSIQRICFAAVIAIVVVGAASTQVKGIPGAPPIVLPPPPPPLAPTGGGLLQRDQPGLTPSPLLLTPSPSAAVAAPATALPPPPPAAAAVLPDAGGCSQTQSICSNSAASCLTAANLNGSFYIAPRESDGRPTLHRHEEWLSEAASQQAQACAAQLNLCLQQNGC